MKTINLLAAVLLSSFTLSSCGGAGNKGTKFTPTEKESTLSDSERQAKISEKKASLSINLDSILSFDGVKFSVMPPSATDGVTQAASERLATKIIDIAAANGVGGLAVNPVLGLVTKATRTESSVTATAPQKTVVKYELTFYCGNFASDDIYASATQSVTGVGSDLNTAILQAFNEVKDSPAIKEMFRKANDNAIAWYNNQGNITMIVDKAIAESNYGLAMALLSSVPSQASSYEYAVKKNQEVSDMFFQSKANELYSNMKAAIAASNGEYNPEAGAYFALIPHNSKIWAEADKAFNEYCKALDSDRRDAITREHLLEMEKLQVEKIKAPYEAQAAIAQINADARVGVAQAKAEGKKNANTGGFLGLGKLWEGGFGLANRILDNFMD